MFIETETTPNPATLKFLPGEQVMTAGTREFTSEEDAAASPCAHGPGPPDQRSGVQCAAIRCAGATRGAAQRIAQLRLAEARRRPALRVVREGHGASAATRSATSAREVALFTVPTGKPRVSAVWASDRSA